MMYAAGSSTERVRVGVLIVIAALASVVASACASSTQSAPAPQPARGSGDDPRGQGPRGAAALEPALDPGGDADDADAEEGAESEVGAGGPRAADPCPRNMALVAGKVCVDRYEASLVEILADGSERPYPHYLPVDGHVVRAVSESGVMPQGYISEVQAQDACAASGKRLCSYGEWKTACMGPSRSTFPYGETRRTGVCHDAGKSAVIGVFGAKAVAASPVSPIIAAANAPKDKSKTTRPAHTTTKGRAAQTTKTRASTVARAAKPAKRAKSQRHGATTRRVAAASARPSSVAPNVWTQLNDPRLGQFEGGLARTGEHPECTNEWGLFDMVGNLHEWVSPDPESHAPAPPNGTFAGGYYLDTAQNGDGCNYRTTAHAHDYHDYSTGFRCCADPAAP